MSMLFEYDVRLSMRPLMVTFGAGAWAYAMGAAKARMAKAIIRTARVVLFMRFSSIRSMTCILLQLVLTDFPRCAQRRYVWRETSVFPVTPSREKIRKMLDLFTANAMRRSRKKPGGVFRDTAN